MSSFSAKRKQQYNKNDTEEPPTKKQCYRWLVGPGDTETKIADTSAQWVHDGVDISARLRSHHDDVVAKASKEDLSNDTDQLCLNCIFYFPQNKNDGIWRIFNEELRNQLAEELERDEYTLMPNEALLLCHSINKDIKQKQDPMDTLLDFRVEHRNNLLLQGFAHVLEQMPSCDEVNERMFTDNSILPSLKEIFPGTEGYVVIGPTTSSKAVAEGIKQFDSSFLAGKPDIYVSKNNIEHLACEAKKPNRESCMLDHALNNDENPEQLLATTGILVEGYNCTAFVLELKYDGVYCLMEVDHFRMMETVEDFLPMIRMYESLLYLKYATTKQGSVENRKKWRRASFQPPMKI
ncbi:hypothetical protein BJV82DRAFT_708214 [Fennellomyces sp. T-0311]|nr:hypothetical protein BJV82DRAFT_708214 [Fennellomyces sp. T-0311]